MREGSADDSSDQKRISVDTGFELTELIVGSDGRSVPLDQEVIRVGSRVGNDIVLEDGDIAGFHCEIWKQRDHYVLVHRASAQATFLNGYPVEFRLLKPGDRIEVGETPIKAVSKSENEDDSIDPEDVENLFEEEETEDKKHVRKRRLSEIKPNQGRPSGNRGRTANRGRTRTRARAQSRSGMNKGLVLQILLGLAGLVVILHSLVHFFG